MVSTHEGIFGIDIFPIINSKIVPVRTATTPGDTNISVRPILYLDDTSNVNCFNLLATFTGISLRQSNSSSRRTAPTLITLSFGAVRLPLLPRKQILAVSLDSDNVPAAFKIVFGFLADPSTLPPSPALH